MRSHEVLVDNITTCKNANSSGKPIEYTKTMIEVIRKLQELLIFPEQLSS
jgi:hypothetical protein